MRTIRAVQRGLADRGGVFNSRELDADANPRSHKRIRRPWRHAKVILTNAITRFEELVGNQDTSGEDVLQLENALRIWGDNRESLTQVPGVSLVGDAVEIEEGSTESKHMDTVLLSGCMVASAEKPTAAETLAISHDYDRQPTPPHIEHQPETLVHGGSVQSTDIPNADGTAKPDEHGSKRNTRPDMANLKRGHSTSMCVSAPIKRARTEKKVRFTELVTLSSAHQNISNPSPFVKLSKRVTLQPHARHTSAEHHRRRYTFNRYMKEAYVPGVWASGAFTKKVDTSWCQVNPVTMSIRVKKDLKEAREEKQVAERLKTFAGLWMGLWWVRHVLSQLDLREVEGSVSEEAEVW